MVRSRSWAHVLTIADDQWGLVTKQQVEATGVAWSTLARQVRDRALERVAHGVYRLRGAGDTDHLELRAAWLQLSPGLLAIERRPEDGVVSHRSAAGLYGIGHLPADIHEFTLTRRKQTRRNDVRLHRRSIEDADWITVRGLPATRPHRIAVDLLAEHEDPAAIGQIIADALRGRFDYPATIATAIAPLASTYGLQRDDGIGLLEWLLELTGDPDREVWLGEAVEKPNAESRVGDVS
jgi:hypothetical protein